MFDIASFRRDFLEGKLLQAKDEMWNKCLGIYNPIKDRLREEKPPGYIHLINDLRSQIFSRYRDFYLKYDILGKNHKCMRNTYYLTIAHLRGRLHISKISGTKFHSAFGENPFSWWTNDVRQSRLIDEKRLIYEWTLEDQERLVKRYIDLYTIIK